MHAESPPHDKLGCKKRDTSISTSSLRSGGSNKRLNGNLVSNKILSKKKPLLSAAPKMKRKKGTVKPPSI